MTMMTFWLKEVTEYGTDYDSLHPASQPVSVIDAIDDHERKKRDDAWEAEKQQLEKERAIREVEYHEARMKNMHE